ncbi:MAG: choice-of-anchor L domain-containing protein [Polyangiaceae bacterium]
MLSLAACKAAPTATTDNNNNTGGVSQGGAGGTPAGGFGGGDGGLFETGPSGSGGGIPNCNSGPDDDADGDGFTPNTGDCNDCDKNVNPGAVEVIDDGMGGAGGGGNVAVDEDCDGLIDDMDPDTQDCDAGLTVDGNPLDGAKAIDLCKVAAGPSEWGVMEAHWVMADGSPPPGSANFDVGHGILSAFGPNVNVQRGQRMLGVSSGAARQPTDPGYQNVSGFSKGYSCTHPPGFPKESPSCGVAVTGGCFDSTGLELLIRAPTNANGFSFNFNFYTFEWPGYVCSQFNDFFTALLIPFPAGQSDGNITFDNLGNPVSVNNAFVEVCGCAGGPPCTAGGKTFDCSLGTAGLIGTGFGSDLAFGQDHGSTSWLLTQAPIAPGEVFTIRFVAYDSGDGVLDSTSLIDNFKWIAEPGTQVGTTPIPDPK